MGGYSSIFIASPLLALWKEREPRYAAVRERADLKGAREAILITTPVSRSGGGTLPTAEGSEAEMASAGEVHGPGKNERAMKSAAAKGGGGATRKKSTTKGPSGGKKKKKKKKR